MLEAGWESPVKLLKGGVKPEIVCRRERVLKESLAPCTPLKNYNRIPIRLIKLCLMNHLNCNQMYMQQTKFDRILKMNS